MKKIILMLVLGGTILTASAQIEKGAILVGGNSSFSYSSVSPSGGSSSSITLFNLKGGYFVAENIALGLNFGYQSISSSSLTTIGVFGRYYPAGKFFVGAGYSSTKASGASSSQGQFNLEGGYVGFVGKSVAFEPAISFNSGDGYSIIGFALGISVYLNRGGD